MMPTAAATHVDAAPAASGLPSKGEATSRSTPFTPRRTPVPATLDALLHAGPAALAQLYRDAGVPRIGDVTGDLRGRLLAIPSLVEPLAALPRLLASSNAFPWRGKSFSAVTEDRGTGMNRVIVDRLRLFRFETFIGPSRAGDFDAMQLDYDNRDNPFFIRAIKDEIRELASGLYLGQAYVQIGASAPKLALYFGLTTRGV
jgi:hypothetical protein